MGILQLPIPQPLQTGIAPQVKPMVTTDNLATVTAAGYMNSVNLEGYPLANTDILNVIYSYNAQTNSGTFAQFSVNIVNGVISLTQLVSLGNVLLPVVAGDIAIFNGTTGQIVDSGVPGASIITNQTLSVVLTAAQVLAAYATPQLIVPAPGAGKALIALNGQVYTSVSTAFAAGGVAILQYGATVHGAGSNALVATIPAAEITAAASQIYSLGGLASATVSTGITNEGLYFSNASTAFTGGAGSTVTLTVNYLTLTATV